ncbi:autotransporter outer membrane beta-barrel domain-containing protein [Xenorhabdus sp. IM139775]|uniref:autotransporter outer membrane beta-barrel domain-containing protein n=1 Tax=Xenorhabdus sp. IM139775 TaxID=3025876 RepID=UPI0023593B0F|nr:autotransporter domain-containing protein [Xenorhabdus sp. IM139775]MDC9594095.1 SGNH/GDSL hydrolase family protein [Xenorhabdus sp. IM139775]
MKKAFLFTPALLALSINAISNAYAYDRVYVFGDSLSDGGNVGRFTTDGATSQLYDEYFAEYIKVPKPTASKDGGTNYAQGGATALRMARQDPKLDAFNPNTQKQVDDYLSLHNNRADSNGIYIHWVGGNDLAEALIAGQKDPLEALRIVKTSAAAASSQINSLIAAGAGLVVVQTVPDVGTTPKLFESLIKTGLEGKGVSEDRINFILQEVHTEINKHVIPNDAARDLALKKVFHTLAEKGEKLIPGASATAIEKELTEGYKKARESATKLTNFYNEEIDKQISQGNGNILRADINGLLNEVIANPLIYGFQNTLGYSCPYGESAAKCSSDDPDFVKKFLFSDNFHPNPLAHKIEAQYIASIFIAPTQVMALAQANRAPVKSALSSLDGHLQQLRNGGNEQGKTGVFGGYSGSQNKTFTLGGDYQLIDNLLLGAMYSNYKDERTPAANFTYEGRGHVLAAYSLWNYYNHGWLSGDVHYSRTNYDSLTRSIQLGEATRRETGATTGKQWGARITAGWDIPVNRYLTTSPIVQYAWDKGEIDGYRESGNSSSSMNFADQDYTSKVGTLGWRVDTTLGRVNPYAAVQFNHQFGDTRYKLSGAINSTTISFTQESSKQSTNWRQYTLGVNANLINNVRGFAAVTRNDGNTQDPTYNFSVGINASF